MGRHPDQETGGFSAKPNHRVGQPFADVLAGTDTGCWRQPSWAVRVARPCVPGAYDAGADESRAIFRPCFWSNLIK